MREAFVQVKAKDLDMMLMIITISLDVIYCNGNNNQESGKNIPSQYMNCISAGETGDYFDIIPIAQTNIYYRIGQLVL